MRRFYVSKGHIDLFTNSVGGHPVHDRSYRTSANIVCYAITRKDAFVVAAALNAMEEKSPSHKRNVVNKPATIL
jgi:hypothetical protein